MNILNNELTTMSLGALNKNISQAATRLAKLASGAKINGASDGASDFAISRKMQIRIRALEQDSANVHNGMALLNVAMGGVQEQINLMKTVKERVLDAANDTNTDSDRLTIQKEINSCFENIDQIACESADYNRRKVLLGGNHYDWMMTWQINDDAEMLPDSDMNIVADVHDTLDNISGPFDLFQEYKIERANIDKLGIPAVPVYDSSGYFSGGASGNPNHIMVDFSPYASAAALNNIGFSVGGQNFVLSTDPAAVYKPGYTKIDISDCSSTEDVAAKVSSSIYSKVTATSSGSIVTFATTENLYAATSNNTTVTGTGYTGYSDRIKTSDGTPSQPAQDAWDEEVPVYDYTDHTVTAASTGAFTPNAFLSGGVDAFHNPYASDVDASASTPAIDASMQRNISGAASGSGFTIHGSSGQTVNVILVDGTSDLTPYTDDDGITYPNVYQVGKSATWSGSLAGLAVSVGGGNITFTASGLGAKGNSCYVSDGFSSTYTTKEQTGITTVHHDATSAVAGTPPTYTDVYYTGVTALSNELNDTTVIDNLKDGTDATNATYTIDLSSYADSTSSTDLEALIADLYGKALTYTYANSYEFIDSTVLGLGTESKFGTSTVKIDLNDLRTAVSSGTPIAEAAANLLTGTLARSESITDGDKITGVKLTSVLPGTYGNTENIYGSKGTLRSYHMDFGSYIADNGITLPNDLYGKGFRVYCPTDSVEWFNFMFMPNMEESEYSDYRPESGTDSLTIKSLLIDISKATDAASLVSTIYEQAESILTGATVPEYGLNTNYNHHLRVAANPNSGELILYDDRRYTINYPRDDIDHIPGNDRKFYPDLQEAGEKIADGAYDNVQLTMRELYCEDIIIHHTDKANMNIHLKIPRTTIDHVLGFDPSKTDLSSYNVLSKKKRDWLLGDKNSHGIIDRGIQYLTDAQTLLGAQYNHLESASSNITTTQENTIKSESTINDADMAREAMEHAKYQILSQSSQAMLAQANQAASSVLNLLQ